MGDPNGGAPAAIAGGANTDANPLVELAGRRPVENEQSSIATREIDQSHRSMSAEVQQSSVISRSSVETQNFSLTREMYQSHGSISAEEQQLSSVSRRSIETQNSSSTWVIGQPRGLISAEELPSPLTPRRSSVPGD